MIVSFFINRTWRLSQFIRPIIIVLESSRVKRVFLNIIKVLPKLAEVLGVMIFTIFTFSWIGLVLWFDIPNQNLYDTIRNSLSSTQTMLSTVNYPDVMIPFFASDFSSVVYFILYYSINYFFLLPLILGVTLKHFKDFLNSKIILICYFLLFLILFYFFKRGKIGLGKLQKKMFGHCI